MRGCRSGMAARSVRIRSAARATAAASRDRPGVRGQSRRSAPRSGPPRAFGANVPTSGTNTAVGPMSPQSVHGDLCPLVNHLIGESVSNHLGTHNPVALQAATTAIGRARIVNRNDIPPRTGTRFGTAAWSRRSQAIKRGPSHDPYRICPLRRPRQGRPGLHLDPVGRARRQPLWLRHSFRRRTGDQSRGADRRGARQLLHHGPVVCPVACGLRRGERWRRTPR